MIDEKHHPRVASTLKIYHKYSIYPQNPNPLILIAAFKPNLQAHTWPTEVSHFRAALAICKGNK